MHLIEIASLIIVVFSCFGTSTSWILDENDLLYKFGLLFVIRRD